MPDIVVQRRPWDRARLVLTSRRELWPLAALVAGLGAACALWLVRAPEPRVAPPAAPARSGGGVVFVHVAGAVRHPGLYRLPEGARVARAVRAARPLPGADLGALNLAAPLTDGLKVDVPRRGEAAAVAAMPGSNAATSGPGAATPGPNAPVSINSADQAALETIPGIGPVRAAAIIAYRTDNGPFASVDELLEVSGIGPATLEAIRPYVTL